MEPNMSNPLDVRTTITLTKEELKQRKVVDVPLGNSYVRVQLPEKVISGNTYGYVGQGNKDANGNRGTLYLTVKVKGNGKGARVAIIAVVALLAVGLVAAAVMLGSQLLGDFSIKDFFGSKDTDTVIETLETIDPDEDEEEEIEAEGTEDETKETSASPAPETVAPAPETPATEPKETAAVTEPTVAAPQATEAATEAATEDVCEHTWKDATFMAPQTCTQCGETKGAAKQLKVGDSLNLGTYMQQLDKDAQPIEWIVVDKRDDRALLLSRYCLDAKPIMEGGTTATWELSTLRSWLNNSFLNDSFTSSQQTSILEVTNRNADNAIFGTDGGADTKDKVFLLSLDEYNYFLSGNSLAEMLDGPTEYAVQNGAASLNATGNAFWWLRTPGKTQKTGTVVGCSDGKIYSEDVVSCLDNTVRPAIWVDLNTLG